MVGAWLDGECMVGGGCLVGWKVGVRMEERAQEKVGLIWEVWVNGVLNFGVWPNGWMIGINGEKNMFEWRKKSDINMLC